MSQKILVFSTADFLPPTGGAEIAFAEIAKRLPEYGFDLICARLRKDKPREETIGNITIHRLGFGMPMLDKLILALAGHIKAIELHRRNAYRLVWSIMATYGAFSAVRVKKKTGLPFLLTLQEGDPFDYIEGKTRMVKGSFREIFRSADGLQAISTYLFEWGKRMGFKGRIAEVIPNGVDLDNFTKPISDDAIAAVRSEFGFPAKATIMVTASRLEPKNGVSDIIKAMALLGDDVCFAVCGVGSLEPELRKLTEELGLQRRVNFMGLVTHDRLPAVIKASDIFIRPSLSEGLGNAFLEAMACQTLVVATPVGGIPDFLADGRTGFLCQPGNPDSVAAAIKKIIGSDDKSLADVKAAAFDLVHSKYQWPLIAQSMRRVIHELAAPETAAATMPESAGKSE